MDINCINCKNHFLAGGSCDKNIVCDSFVEDTEDSLVDKLIRYMSKDMYIDNSEAAQIMCEIIDIFETYNMHDDYTFLLNDITYDCNSGLSIGKLNVKDYSKEAWDYGLNILIESDVYYMFRYDTNTFQEEQEYEGNIGGSKSYIQCKAKLRRLLKRYNLEYMTSNYGYTVSFRKLIESEKVG